MKRVIFAILATVAAISLHSQPRELYVDASLDDDAACADDTYFNSMHDALIEAQNLQQKYTYTHDNPLTIKIAPSVYWIDDPDDPEISKPMPGEGLPYGLKLKLSHVRMIGLSDDPQDVVLACNRGQTQGADGNFTMLHFTGDDIVMENLTLGNYCNVDLIYPRDPRLNRAKRAEPIVQAQLAICDGDRYVARNCRFISRLNLCPLAGGRRVLFDNCYFECTDDALCGSGVYLGCRFTLFSGKPFFRTDWEGARFLDCDLHALTKGRQYLVKAGSQVAMVDCRWTSESPDLYIGWTQDPTDDLRSYQHNITLNGQPLEINADRPYLTVDMTGKPLLEGYKCGDVYNVYNLLKGIDGWNPLNQDTLMLASQPTMLTLNRRKAEIETGVDTLTLTADLPDVTWSVDKSCRHLVDFTVDDAGRCKVVSRNEGEIPCKVNMLATTPAGLEAACVVTAKPPVLAAPQFTSLPAISRTGDTLRVDYTLDLGGRDDFSYITWYRAKSSDGHDAIPVAVSRHDSPRRDYRLTAADNGHYITATVEPRHVRSHAGKAERAITDKPVKGVKPVKSLATDFSEMPTSPQPLILPGFWTMDSYKPSDTSYYDWTPDPSNSWYYGHGCDGAARCEGLAQAGRGARLLYNPVAGNYGDMELAVTLDPCKTAGQGFGSATGQYLDIFIKYDPATMTGYGLRIIRTVKNDKAVDFMLMKYTSGESEAITEPVSAICFRKGCRVKLTASGRTLTAHVDNEGELPEIHREGLQKEVNLRAEITPNAHGGLGFQHTGTTGAGATLIRNLDASWD